MTSDGKAKEKDRHIPREADGKPASLGTGGRDFVKSLQSSYKGLYPQSQPGEEVAEGCAGLSQRKCL